MPILFPGFEPSTAVTIPTSVFNALLARIHNIAELKVVLYAVYRAYSSGQVQFCIPGDEFVNGAVVADVTGSTLVLDRGAGLVPSVVKRGLERAVADGFLARHDVCPHCHNEISGAGGQAEDDAQANSSQAIDNQLGYCPACEVSLIGREKTWYSLRWQSPADFAPQAFGVQPEVVSSVRSVAATNEGRDNDHSVRAFQPSAPAVVAGPPAATRSPSPVRSITSVVKAPASFIPSPVLTDPASQTIENPQSPVEDTPTQADERHAPAAYLQCDVTLGDGRTVPLARAWSLLCENLKGQLSRDAFDTTFRQATVGWDGPGLVLDFPSIHMAEAVSETYYYALERAMSYVFGRKVPVRLTIQMERD